MQQWTWWREAEPGQWTAMCDDCHELMFLAAARAAERAAARRNMPQAMPTIAEDAAEAEGSSSVTPGASAAAGARAKTPAAQTKAAPIPKSCLKRRVTWSQSTET